MMKRKKTAAYFFDDAEINDLKSLINVKIKSDKIFKQLKSDTQINYPFVCRELSHF
jgi:hypothetical protein